MTRMIQAFSAAAFATALMISAAQALPVDAAAANQAIIQATELQAHAMSLDDGWSTTQAVLDQAHAAYAQHDYATALAKARRAQKLARISVAQAESQKKLWRSEVPR